MDHKEAAETLEREARALGLHIEVRFIPFSQSRNAKEKTPSVNWRIQLRKGFATLDGEHDRLILECDYSQGIGWLKTPKRFDPECVDGVDAIRAACEKGEGFYGQNFFADVKAVPPTFADVFASLLLDASALDYPDFESWASDCGYDPDSREAERIYREYMSTATKLRAAIREEALRRFSKLAQDI